MVIGYKSLWGKCAAIPCHIQLAALVVMGVEWAEGWGAWPIAAQVFTWALIRLVNSDACILCSTYSQTQCHRQVLNYGVRSALEQVSFLQTIPYTEVLSRNHPGISMEHYFIIAVLKPVSSWKGVKWAQYYFSEGSLLHLRGTINNTTKTVYPVSATE